MALYLADAADLEQWADRVDSRFDLPDLIRRLVLATASPRELVFRAREGTGYSGWDGFVDAPAGTTYVPQGVSGWEMGTGADVAQKVTADYGKRTRRPRPFVKSETTFVFCTPRRWPGRDAWVAARRARTRWAGLRVYDADDLAAWLTTAPGVHVWLSAKLGLPVDRVQDLSAWWESWSAATRPPISPSLLLSGREKERDALIKALVGTPRILTVRTASEAESLGFVAATLLRQDPELRDALLSRALLVEEEGAWRYFAQQKTPLILIPRFTNEVLVNEAVRHGHHVVLAVGVNHRLPVLVDVPRLRSDEARKVLEQEGLAPAAAGHAAALARRSLAAYRRVRAAMPFEPPPWANGEQGLLLALLVVAGSWSEGFDGDREVLERLTEVPYGEVKALLTRWRDSPDPLFRQIGSEWHVLAKEDAWRLLAQNVSAGDLRRFVDMAVEVLTEGDPKWGMSNEERMAADIKGIRRRYSAALREGFADSLGMLGALSSGEVPVATSDGSNTANFATEALRKLFGHVVQHPQAWLDIAPNLPALAEASPDLFLQILEEDLQAAEPGVLTLFAPQPGLMSSDYGYPNLLWALEALAWSDALFSRVALAMARLAAVAPKTSISNSPADSLLSFFRLWYPQCGAPFEHRMQALDLIRSRVPDVAWTLMLRLLSRGSDGASVSGGPGARAVLWRDWPSQAPKVSGEELMAAVESISGRILDDAGLSPSRWSALVQEFDQLSYRHLDRALGQLRGLTAQLDDESDRALIWDQLRRFMASSNEVWGKRPSLPKPVLDELERLVETLAPQSLALRHRWLFEAQVRLPADPGSYMTELGRLRASAVADLLAEGGLEAVFTFSEAVEVPHEVGSALFSAGLDERGTEHVLRLLGEPPGPRRQLARSFVWRAMRDAGQVWRDTYLSPVAMATWTEDAQAAAILSCPLEAATLDLLDQMPEGTRERYWQGVDGVWSREPDVFSRGIEALLCHRRPRLALYCLAMQSYGEGRLLSPYAVQQALFESATTPLGADSTRISSHDVGQLLGWLRRCPDTDLHVLAQLEWMYLPGLDVPAPHLTLHDRLAIDPAFFVEIVGLLYRRDVPETPSPPSDAETADRAWHLLNSWGTVSGMRADGTFDGDYLKEWAQSVVSLLQKEHLTRGGLGAIGEVLARGPAAQDGTWPPSEICDIIQGLESPALDDGFRKGVFNGRGVTTRGPYDGGELERQQADRYDALAAQLDARWPRVGAVLRQLAREYRGEASWHDQRADLGQDQSG